MAPAIPNPHQPPRRKTLAAGLLLILSFGTATAGPNDLAAAVEAAYQRHPDLGLVEAERGVGDALRGRASQPLSADPAINVKYQSDALGSGDGYREWEGGVELPLWWPGQRATQMREAEQTLNSADAMREATRLVVAGEVRERLWRLALARSARDEARLALAAASELERDVARRVEAGELPRTDLLLAQKETMARDDALQQAESLAVQAEQRFTHFTGVDALAVVAAEAVTDAQTLPETHPGMSLAMAAVDKARAQRDRVAGERRGAPSLWLGGKTTRDTAGGSYDSAVGVELTVPFGSRVHAAPALAAAEQSLSEAVARRDQTRRTLEEDLAAARLEYQRAERAIALAGQRQALADESLRLSRRAFELGETDLVRLLQARSDATTAHQASETRRLELGQAAARLNQILGVIPQ